MKLVYKFGLVYGVAELVHQLLYWHRYTYFNNMRIMNKYPTTAILIMIQSLMKKNPLLLQRTKLYKHTEHIKNENDLYDALIPHCKERPANQLQVGCSKLYWRYSPLALELFMKSLRQAGNLYLRYVQGFSRTWHKTDDGYYSVWSHHISGTKPLLFFPGVGLGAIPYANIAKSFGRTVHIVEVPNLGYATPLSNSQATPETIYEVVSKHVEDGTDIFAHSYGSFHTAMYLNAIHGKSHPNQNVVICDGLVNSCDFLVSHIAPFVGISDYDVVRKKPKRWLEFIAFIYGAVHNLEVQSCSKRFIDLSSTLLWRDYPNTNIQYVYSKYDIMYDTEFIAKHSDCILLPKGGHGYSVFGAGNRRFHSFS
jgi:hypothetical protein